ncbi:hypothetical protein [Streptacidiphilus jiangxiensis]|uniref:Uncharacterized protein n=1 Tax=Streptacidiphilus jiangxiensis TaxID=235985 RepID=A0A1H7N6N6_STRJI|nr:hypothetical protein [Streptacidiphilus jiangxiensis]SEL18575.1 hypothetical protein SAMN05414137_106212 [Streptacidiphilus jiangxiensis]
MSRTTPIRFGDTMFWAYDVALGVLFAEAIHVAERSLEDPQPSWRSDLIQEMRVNAVVGSSLSVLLDPLDADQRAALLTWVQEACSRLTARGGVSAAEVASWDVLDGESIHLRGAGHVAAGPVAELGEAIRLLLAGALPPAPEGQHWYYGTPSGRSSI